MCFTIKKKKKLITKHIINILHLYCHKCTKCSIGLKCSLQKTNWRVKPRKWGSVLYDSAGSPNDHQLCGQLTLVISLSVNHVSIVLQMLCGSSVEQQKSLSPIASAIFFHHTHFKNMITTSHMIGLCGERYGERDWGIEICYSTFMWVVKCYALDDCYSIQFDRVNSGFIET